MATVTNYNFDYDMSQVILWQYGDAERLKSIIANEQAFMDENVSGFYKNFNKDVLNISTANAFGLSVWGILLGVPRPTYTVDGVTYTFTDAQYRLLLRARIYLLTFDGSTRALNEFFHILFPDMQITITDNGNMTADISILNELDPEIAILFQSPYVDIFLPRPSGVAYNMNTSGSDYSKILTFEGQTYDGGRVGGNFDHGVFYQG